MRRFICPFCSREWWTHTGFVRHVNRCGQREAEARVSGSDETVR